MGEALELAVSDMDKNNKKIRELRNLYISEISKKIKYIKINGDMEKRLPGNANISFKGVDGSKLIMELDKKGICASSGSACSAGILNPSPVLLAIGLPISLAKSGLRITFGKNNNLEETMYLIESLEEIVEKLRYG